MNSSLELVKSSHHKHLKTLLEGVENNLKDAVEDGVKRKEFKVKDSISLASERLFALAFTIEEMGKLGKDKDFLLNISNGTLKEFNIAI